MDVTSYQSAALERVEAQVGAQSMSDEKLVQYYSLYCVLESTYGKSNAVIETDPNYSGADIPGWKVSTGWFETNLDPCDGWFGVDCENDQVVTLNLYDNELSGDLAPEVKLLASDGPYSTGAGNLRLLDLFNNNLLSNGGDSSWVTDLGSNLRKYYHLLFRDLSTNSNPFLSLGYVDRIPLHPSDFVRWRFASISNRFG